MNKIVKTHGPRRTSTREATERAPHQPRPQSVAHVDVKAVLADRHPEKAEDYALHLFYLANRHNPFFKCTAQSVDENMEDVHVVINDESYDINIRTGAIVKK